MKNIYVVFIFFYFMFWASNVFAQNPEVGQVAPEIAQKNPEGEIMKLSDLRGKLVLVDFWASWCAPCRKENPTLVKVYEKFHDTEFVNGQGFAIYSVSLDSKKERWLKAIEDDNMQWPWHVSDLKGWRNEAAKEYGIRAVPANYLINADGEIVDIYLRGNEIEAALNKYKKTWLNNMLNK